MTRPEQQNADINAVTAEMIEAGLEAAGYDQMAGFEVVKIYLAMSSASHPTKAPSPVAGDVVERHHECPRCGDPVERYGSTCQPCLEQIYKSNPALRLEHEARALEATPIPQPIDAGELEQLHLAINDAIHWLSRGGENEADRILRAALNKGASHEG